MPERLYSDSFDSIRQSAVLATNDPALALPYYHGRLALNSFIVSKNVLTDAQYLDGAFFHAIADQDRLKYLPSRYIEIRTRAPAGKLESAFVGLATAGKKGTWFSCLPASHAENVQNLLGSAGRDRGDIKTVSDVLEVWRDAGVPLELIERKRQSYQRLFEWGNPLTIQWNDPLIFSEALISGLDLAKAKLDATLKEESSIDVMRQVWGAKSDRNLVTRLLRDAVEGLNPSGVLSPDTVAATREICTIDSAFNEAYNDAAAVQHEALPEVTRTPLGKSLSDVDREISRIALVSHDYTSKPAGDLDVVIPISFDFMTRLSKFAPEELDLVRADNATNLAKWHETNDPKCLEQVVESLYRRMSLNKLIGGPANTSDAPVNTRGFIQKAKSVYFTIVEKGVSMLGSVVGGALTGGGTYAITGEWKHAASAFSAGATVGRSVGAVAQKRVEDGLGRRRIITNQVVGYAEGLLPPDEVKD